MHATTDCRAAAAVAAAPSLRFSLFAEVQLEDVKAVDITLVASHCHTSEHRHVPPTECAAHVAVHWQWLLELLLLLLLLVLVMLPMLLEKGPRHSRGSGKAGPPRVGFVDGCPGVEYKHVVPHAEAGEAANHHHPSVIEEAGRVALHGWRAILAADSTRQRQPSHPEARAETAEPVGSRVEFGRGGERKAGSKALWESVSCMLVAAKELSPVAVSAQKIVPQGHACGR